MRSKVTVVGAGNVGATTAQRIFEKGYADVVLVDIVPGLPQGKALDMLQSGPILGSDAKIIGTNSYDETEGSDLIVITSGLPRKPGMTRDDLLDANSKIVASVVKETSSRSPQSKILIVTNPLDAMTQCALDVSGFDSKNVFGMAGILDTARFKTFVSMELDVSVDSISGFVFGGQGDTMVPVTSTTNVGGVSIEKLIPKARLDEIIQRTRDGGIEIVNFLKSGSAYYAPSAAVVQMVEAVLLDKKEILPCTAYLNGEYGHKGIYLGIAVKLGSSGIEQIVEFNLTDHEQSELNRSADAVVELVEAMKKNSYPAIFGE